MTFGSRKGLILQLFSAKKSDRKRLNHDNRRDGRLAIERSIDEGQTVMAIGDRLRQLREDRKLSQGDLEKRSGLLRCYISRIENNHIVPAVETLEKFARALAVPMYVLFYEGDEPPKAPTLPKVDDQEFGRTRKQVHYLNQLIRLLSKMSHADRKLIFELARKTARN
jgi:transcriptional regulator with XRE-family HTH domain